MKEYLKGRHVALIDMDGTLYDSMPGHAAAWKRLMDEQGVFLNSDEFYSYEGMTGAATINLLFQRELGRTASENEVKELYALKTKYFQEIASRKIMPGASVMLSELKKRGFDCVLVTGSGQRSLIDNVNQDFPGVFSHFITSADVSRGKPHPEPYLKAMELAGAKPEECIVIENAPLGVASGAASGALTIGVLTGPIPAEEMKRAGAHLLFPSMTAFAEALTDTIKEL